jgi:hypothetical protein
MCAQVNYTADCPSKTVKDSTIYGFVKIMNTKTDEEGKKTTTVQSCQPIFIVASDSKFYYTTKAVESADKRNSFDVKSLTMFSNTASPNVYQTTIWDIKCPSSGEEVLPSGVKASFNKDTKTVEISFNSKNACGGDYNKFIIFF